METSQKRSSVCRFSQNSISKISLRAYWLTRNFDVGLSFRSLCTLTPFPRHYRARFHTARVLLAFSSNAGNPPPVCPIPTRFPSHWLARFFRAYLRDTYLPRLSGNLTPASSPGRSPPFRHTPTHRWSFETISRISRPLGTCTYIHTFMHHPRNRVLH